MTPGVGTKLRGLPLPQPWLPPFETATLEMVMAKDMLSHLLQCLCRTSSVEVCPHSCSFVVLALSELRGIALEAVCMLGLCNPLLRARAVLQSEQAVGLEISLPASLRFQHVATSPIELNFPLQLEFKYSNKFVLETLTAPLCHLQGNTLWVFFSGRWRFLCA